MRTRHLREITTQPEPPAPALPERRVYTLAEAAAILGIDRVTAWRQVKRDGQLAGVPAIQVARRKTVFSRAAIDRLVDGLAVNEAVS